MNTLYILRFYIFHYVSKYGIDQILKFSHVEWIVHATMAVRNIEN